MLSFVCPALRSQSRSLAFGLAFVLTLALGGFVAPGAHADASAANPDSAASTADSTAAPAAIDTIAAPTAIDTTAALPSSSSSAGDASEVARRIVRLGLENVAAADSADTLRVRYENRHFRHAAEALGAIARETGRPIVGFEQRLGLLAAAITDTTPGKPGFQVAYPCEVGLPTPPRGTSLASTRRTVDLLIGPLFTYRLGGILDPVETRTDIQTELRYNPWPGGRLRGAMIFPVHDDFSFGDSEHPDVKNVRPGPVLLDQYAWVSGAGLFSSTAGLLGNNRYGLSMGLARPFRSGELMFDVQSDFTGFIAFQDSGVVYSTANRWTAFAGLTYRPPNLDLAVRLRVARFLHGDQGVELELRRAMGDFDVGFFLQHTDGVDFGGVRLAIPIPPMVRPVGWPVRVLPVERITFVYREDSDPIGELVGNIGSREEFLKQLDRSSLDANRYRYLDRRAGTRHRAANASPQWVSLSGMTGFINTPWAGVMKDREFEVGYNKIPKEATYLYRGEHSNEVYYASLGFLPHVEVGMRWTVSPGAHPFRVVEPESPYTDADRMFSGRIEIVEPRPMRPGFAVGVEDVRGTKRFHSSYGVVGMPFDIYRLQNRVTIGYAPRVFTASRWVLDGLFGAFEVSPQRSVAAALEYDTEKWNTMLGINLGFGLRARVALLDLEHLSFGAGWFRAL